MTFPCQYQLGERVRFKLPVSAERFHVESITFKRDASISYFLTSPNGADDVTVTDDALICPAVGES